MATGNGTVDGLPFATRDGKPKAPSASANAADGGHDFTSAPQTGTGKGGQQTDTIKSRPQPAYKQLPGLPNSQEIPKGDGGKILQMDPRGGSERAGTSGGPKGAPHTPFKSLK
jgi:hypothetical protein